MTQQMIIDFTHPAFSNLQLKNLADYMYKGNTVTTQDHNKFGIAGSAFTRRIADLIHHHHVPISKRRVVVTRADGRKVKITEYFIELTQIKPIENL